MFPIDLKQKCRPLCLVFLLAGTISPLWAQPMFSLSEGFVSITDDAVLNIDGDIYLNANTVIYNEDTLRNAGDWINEVTD